MNNTPFTTNSLILNAFEFIKKKDFLKAKNLLEKAISINPEIFEANHNLAILNFQLGNIDDSIVFFEKSKKLKPEFAQVYFNTALAYDRTNQIELAIENFKKVTDLDSSNSLAFLNIGILYKKKFSSIKAKKYLSKSLDLNSNNLLAYNELFSLYERSNQMEEYKILLDKLKKSSIEKDLFNFYYAVYNFSQKNYHKAIEVFEKINLKKEYLHQNINKHTFLAKSYDHINKFDKAYQHFKKNNELVNSAFGKNINEKNFVNYINQRINFFNNFKQENWKKFHIKNNYKEPIFIIGFPRSGTTLLDTILRTNKFVEVVEEKPIIRNFLIELEKRTKNDLSLLNDIDEEYIYKMQNFYFSEREKYLKNKKSDFIIDKMPLNIIHVGEILRFFPNAKFIFALRNPYDCVLSCFMQQFDLNPAMKNFLSIEGSANLYDLVMKLWKIYTNKFQFNFHFVKYEEIVSNFEKTTKDLYNYLELTWSEDVKNFYITGKNRLDISTPSYNQVSSPLYSRSLDRWKNYKKHFVGVENILDFWVNEFNY